MRRIILSVDGLRLDDVDALLDLMPGSRAYFNEDKILTLKAAPFTSAQPIWAELLTGRTWYENGCFGYSRPDQSLNTLKIFEERDLFVSPELLKAESDGARTLCINVPLLKPRPAQRNWLSDGSMPSIQFVSPKRLVDAHSVLNDYLPRGISDISTAFGLRTAPENCLATETKRVECAATLLQRDDWSRCLFRITVFDHLSHVLGLGFLAAKDLTVSDKIKDLTHFLDETLCNVLAKGDVEIFLLSAYSHTSCRETLSLNNVLATGRFFQLDTDAAREKAHRIEASEALSGAAVGGYRLRSAEGRVNTKTTLAASPIAGCVFINRKGSFVDGVVGDQEYASVREEVADHLSQILAKRYWQSAKIFENKRAANEVAPAPLPDFVVAIDGVEFTDIAQSFRTQYDIPRTTHSSSGFMVMPKNHINRHKQLTASQVIGEIGEF